MTIPRTQKPERKPKKKTRIQLLAHAATLAAKIAEVQDEILFVQAQNYHLFTLVFAGGQEALCEVWGARDAHHALSIAHSTADTEPFQVIEGDRTEGKAQIVYHWCRQCALEVNGTAIRRHVFSGGSVLHIVLFSDETRSTDDIPH